jgi:hypothetical protein
MPKKVEEALYRQAKKKGLNEEETKRYVFGTMNKRGLLNKSDKIKSTERSRKSDKK